MLKSVNKLYYTCMFIHIHSQLCKQTALYILHINTCTLSILHINYKNSTVLYNNNRFYSTQSTKINKNLKI